MPISFPENINPFNLFPFNKVPPSKQIVIKEGTKNIMEQFAFGEGDNQAIPVIMLEGEISLNISSEYAPLIPANQNTFLSLVSGSFGFGAENARIGSGQFVQQGIQVWKTSQPISFSLNGILMAQGSGQKEIMAPIKKLIALTLPDKNTQGTGWGLIPPGPNISTIIGSEKAQQLDNALGNYINLVQAKGVLGLSIGNYLNFNSVVMTKCVPTFMSGMVKEKTSNKLYPVQCNINMDFITTEIATSNMINSIDHEFG